MAKPKDYYELLGVERKASADEIRSAYRKLARKLHPDVNKAPDAAKRFAEVQEAYDVLSDPEKRKAFDRFGHAGVGVGPRGPASGTGPGTGPFEGGFYTTPGSGGGWTHYQTGGFGDEDVESIFEQMFGGAGRRGGAGFGRGGSPFGGGARTRTRAQPQRGIDLEHTISITFMTAALGGSEQLRIGASGVGAAGAAGEAQSITVKIPASIESGAKLRVRGKGQPGHNGGPAGDLILAVQVGQHPYFRREGLDLLVDVPITIAEAVTGVSVEVPLLAGTVQIKVPPGASSSRRLRVRGKGIVESGGKGKAGDFYAVIQIVAPAANSLGEKARRAVDELAGELQNPRESAPWADDVRVRS